MNVCKALSSACRVHIGVTSNIYRKGKGMPAAQSPNAIPIGLMCLTRLCGLQHANLPLQL